jgi:hypothetical protein
MASAPVHVAGVLSLLEAAAFALETLEELRGFPVDPVHAGIAQSPFVLVSIYAYS